MMKINLIVLGRLKEKYLVSAVDEYKKRLSRYCDLKIEELSPEYLPENPSAAQVEAALSGEAEKIKKHIPPGSFTVALCVEGKQITSEKFAELIKEKSAQGTVVNFVVGSSYGLHKTVKTEADMRLSLSEMTFPHQLFRCMLTEQIYRAFKIIEGGTYHK